MVQLQSQRVNRTEPDDLRYSSPPFFSAHKAGFTEHQVDPQTKNTTINQDFDKFHYKWVKYCDCKIYQSSSEGCLAY